jgi:hypothetical protein
MSTIIVYTSVADLDRLAVPSVIYTETIARNTTAITTYFENNPQLMLQFVGMNSALKRANQLNYEKKCGCLYTFPWNTQYNVDNSISQTTLNFSQQVELYQYIIQHWNTPDQSYLQFLSAIALGILLKLKRAKYNIDNNLDVCCSPLTTQTFVNNYAFLQYLRTNNLPL